MRERVAFKRLGRNVIKPYKAYEGDAGFDLRATIPTTLLPGKRELMPTGLSLAIPEGYCGLVLPRSGLAIGKGLSIVNAPGLIDSGYRGEIKVALINLGDEKIVIHQDDRIAQLLIIKLPDIELTEVLKLPESERSIGGFGSSGVR